jgi:hypothetical protein
MDGFEGLTKRTKDTIVFNAQTGFSGKLSLQQILRRMGE